MKMNFTIPVAALIAGAALGYCLAPSRTPAEPEGKPAAETPRRKLLPDAGAEEQLKALRSRIKDLEKALAESQQQTSEQVQENRNEGNRRRGQGWSGPDWKGMRERLEQWKKENPEEFARMEKRRQEIVQERAKRAQTKIDFFSSIDTSRMSKSDREFPEEYSLKVNETRTGIYVYEAPAGETDLNISFVEYYENDTEGDGFWVYFTAEEK